MFVKNLIETLFYRFFAQDLLPINQLFLHLTDILKNSQHQLISNHFRFVYTSYYTQYNIQNIDHPIIFVLFDKIQ